MIKISKSVVIGSLAALSLAIAGCSDDSKPVTADCVQKQADGSHKAVSDNLCRSGASGGGGGSGAFVWLYGGSYGSGGRVTGGTYSKPANTNINTRSGTVITSGFGSSGKSGAGS